MDRLTKEELQGRLRLDYRLANAMQCAIMEISAHGSRDDAAAGRNPIQDEADASNAWFYRATYRIKTLLGSARCSNPVAQPIIILVDLNAHGNYPYTRPESLVIGGTVPWSPHFQQGVHVCFEEPGKVWRADGHTHLGRLLLHLARLINFDEVIANPTYGGYNPAAVAYWRTTLGSNPITPALSYPAIPSWFFGLKAASGKASVMAPLKQGEMSPGAPRSRAMAATVALAATVAPTIHAAVVRDQR